MSKTIYKHDIESRFRSYGLLWSYFSIDCFNEMLAIRTKHFNQPLDLPTYVLVAENDGYWNNASKTDVEQLVRKYIRNPDITYKNTSHLWVVMPDNLHSFLGRARRNDHF